jgi:Kef-type K+ transport system membrane component KefB
MDLGVKFWVAVVGIAVGGVVAFVLILALLGWAWYTWGFLGMMILFIAVLSVIAWISDRRERKRYEGLPE